jgi:hypothetical protein
VVGFEDDLIYDASPLQPKWSEFENQFMRARASCFSHRRQLNNEFHSVAFGQEN